MPTTSEDHGQMAIDLIAFIANPTAAQASPNTVALLQDMAIVHARAAWREALQAVVKPATCPGCSGHGTLSDDPQVFRCDSCGGVFTSTEPIVMEAAIKFVSLQLPMLANAGADGSFYFDLDIVTSWKNKREVARVHGWADRRTKRVVQFG